jgi:hypothetical protein
MKRFFQSVSVLLALLLLAPPVWATMQCTRAMAHSADGSAHSMQCCDGMDGMSMPMGDTVQSANNAQLSQGPCCIVTVTDAVVPASVSDDELILSTAAAPLLAVEAPALLQTGWDTGAQSPPLAVPRGPSLSRLCTLLI